jgi:ribosomal protein L17
MFIHGAIQTTEAKAQALVSTIESLANTIITKPELIAKRELFRYLQDQTWVNNVVSKFKETFGQQSSNFTQISRIKRRFGDDALIVKLSFVKPVKFAKSKPKKVEEKSAKKADSKKPVKKENKKILSKVEGKKETK